MLQLGFFVPPISHFKSSLASMFRPRALFVTAILGGAMLMSARQSWADEVRGFTEPYRDIDVAASEIGVVGEVKVREGDKVTKGQVLASLDDAIAQATVNIAKQAMDSSGRLESAASELQLLDEILARLTQLRDREHASQQELERALAQQRTAAAQLKAVREELELRALEYERARIQLDRRSLRSPIDGLVVQIVRDAGEYVSPTEPVVVRVVQLDPLLVVFSTPVARARGLAVGKPVDVRIGDEEIAAKGLIEFVSPASDPQSGTARVRVKIPNPEQKLPCGAICRLLTGQIASEAPARADRPTLGIKARGAVK